MLDVFLKAWAYSLLGLFACVVLLLVVPGTGVLVTLAVVFATIAFASAVMTCLCAVGEWLLENRK